MTSDILRTAVLRIMSQMLDNPDEGGIYPTGEFMNRIEALLESMMAAPEVVQLSGSEALFGFVAWLTTNGETYAIGPDKNCAIWPGLIQRFIDTNGLHAPRSQWGTLLTHPHGNEVAHDVREGGEESNLGEKREALDIHVLIDALVGGNIDPETAETIEDIAKESGRPLSDDESARLYNHQ